MQSQGRYFSTNIPVCEGDNADRGEVYYRSHISALYEKCRSNQSRYNSLYIGELGTRCYLPYRLATSKSFDLDFISSFKNIPGNNTTKQKQIELARWDILQEALSFAEQVRNKQKASGRQRISLLEGNLVGALVMHIVISNSMLSLVENVDIKENTIASLKDGMEDSQHELLTFALTDVMELAPSECEILYGRAGYLKAIAFIRREIGDPEYGKILARTLVGQIWREGKRFSEEINSTSPLMWEWHGSLYLGAAHGVAGILHTLLDFQDDLIEVDMYAWDTLERTVAKLNEFCWQGNLASSIQKTGRELDLVRKCDRLVQFCHGAPGHVLLLTQMYIKAQEHCQVFAENAQRHLADAKQITENVILSKGLLRKGVGLCHGISGNAYCFLSLHNAESKKDVERNTAHTPKKRMHEPNKWLRYAYVFANYALDHMDELELNPDRPFSLFEGLAGLICLFLDLIDLKDGVEPRFPCFEF